MPFTRVMVFTADLCFKLLENSLTKIGFIFVTILGNETKDIIRKQFNFKWFKDNKKSGMICFKEAIL